MFASKGEIFGHWECEWQYPYEDLREAPKLTAKGIQVLLKVRYRCFVIQFIRALHIGCLW